MFNVEASGLCAVCPSKRTCGRIYENLQTLQGYVNQSAKLKREHLSIKTHLERAGYHYPQVKHKDECWFMGKRGVVNYYDNKLNELYKSISEPKRA